MGIPFAGSGAIGPGPRRFRDAEQKPKDTKSALKKLWRFVSYYKVLLVVMMFCSIGATAFSVVGPRVLSQATTLLFEGAKAQAQSSGTIDFAGIGHILLIALLIYAVSSILMFVQSWFMVHISQKVSYDLRARAIDKIQRLPLSYFDSQRKGDVLSRITNDVDTLSQSINQGLTQAITSLVTIVGVLAMMFTIHVRMTLIVLCMVPITLLATRVVVRKSQPLFRAQQARLGAINTRVEETFSGLEVVKSFSQEHKVRMQFVEENDALFEASWKSLALSGLLRPVTTLISNAAYVGVVVSGVYFASVGAITVGHIQAFVQYVTNFTRPLDQLAQISNVFQQMAAAAERIFEVLEAKEEPIERNTRRLRQVTHAVEFDNVTFEYIPGQPIIKNFSLLVEPGQTVAIVGKTGSGKTTLMKLLMRFYEITSGDIYLDGLSLSSITRNEARSLFGMVLQDTWLLEGTIRENIAYGIPDADIEQVQLAAKAALAHNFIMDLPDGYETIIDAEGSSLSAGQRQLISIARTFLVNRSMLILDEATSSVDTRTERRIQKAMELLMKDRTSFVIAHRLSTIRNADIIVVLDEGCLVEYGTHDELLAAQGAYAALYNAQFENRV
ncbi:MAG: ABC transporter ATP-binding protein [Eggerthellaceae bacterium]|nr:ABC transporter ATP-binding protein [Eggerthellaceae bacterium]